MFYTEIHVSACMHACMNVMRAYIHTLLHTYGFIAIAVVKYSQYLKRSFFKCIICNCGQIVVSKHPKKNKRYDISEKMGMRQRTFLGEKCLNSTYLTEAFTSSTVLYRCGIVLFFFYFIFDTYSYI